MLIIYPLCRPIYATSIYATKVCFT